MRNELLIFYLFFGLLILASLNLFIVLSVRVRGETPFYKLDPRSPNFKKMQQRYRRRGSSKAIVIALVALLLSALLTALQLKGILDEHLPNALDGLLFGPVIMVLVFVVVIRSLSMMLRQDSNKRTKNGSSNDSNDGTWLV